MSSETDNIINLETVLKGKTVLLLGAGASADYGFPLWDDLKKDFLGLIDTRSGLPEFAQHSGASYWRDVLTENMDTTVDHLAANARDPGVELFQMMTLQIFNQREAQDNKAKKMGWVENLTYEYIRLLKLDERNSSHVKPLLENLSIISLNYDRSFAHRFIRSVDQFLGSVYPNSYVREGVLKGISKRFRIIIQPHGSLGDLPEEPGQLTIKTHSRHYNSNADISLRYGAKIQFNGLSDPRLNSIMPVDLLGYGGTDNQSYLYANTHLKEAQTVIIIGVSMLGLANSQLKLNGGSKVICIGKKGSVEGCSLTNCYAANIKWRA